MTSTDVLSGHLKSSLSCNDHVELCSVLQRKTLPEVCCISCPAPIGDMRSPEALLLPQSITGLCKERLCVCAFFRFSETAAVPALKWMFTSGVKQFCLW